MSEDRISRLSQRFNKHTAKQQTTSSRNRDRHSFYLDAELVNRLDRTYREMNHQVYPKEISKSVFLETLIEYGLDNPGDLKNALVEAAK